MLDQKDGDLRRQRFDGGKKFMAFHVRHPGGRLVEQEHLRPACESKRDFQQTLFAVGQDRGAFMHHIDQTKTFENFDDLVGHRGFAADDPPPLGAGAHAFGNRLTDRFQRREIREQLIDLEGPRHAKPDALMRRKRGNVLAVENDAAVGRLEDAGEEVDHGGLAGAVRADQRVARTFLDRERKVMGGNNAAEALFEADGFEDRHDLVSVRRRTADRCGTRNEARAKTDDRAAYDAGPFLDALAADEHDHHQHKADPELPVLRGQTGDPVLQKFVDHGADQTTVQIAGAADDEDEEKIGRAFEREHVERAERRRLRQQRAGDAGQPGGERIDARPCDA